MEFVFDLLVLDLLLFWICGQLLGMLGYIFLDWLESKIRNRRSESEKSIGG